jgi:hypothetical protein
MGTLWITELTSRSADGLARLPSVAAQSVAIDTVSTVSKPFNEAARSIRILADVDCCILVGRGELVASEGDAPITAGSPEVFAVAAGDCLAVICRVVENNMSIDPLALLAAAGDPAASKVRMQEIVTSSTALAKQRKELKALAVDLDRARKAADAEHERRKQELAEAEGAHAARLTQLEKKQRELSAQEAAAQEAAVRLAALDVEISERTDTLSRLNAQLSALRERFAA